MCYARQGGMWEMIGSYGSIGLLIGFFPGVIATILFGTNIGFLVVLSSLMLGLMYGFKKSNKQLQEEKRRSKNDIK